MVRVSFADDQTWRDCCDLSHMVSRWGTDVARQVSHRLQQLEAMNSVADLEFLPLDYQVVGDTITILIIEDISLVVRQGHSAGGTGMEVATLVIGAVVEQPKASGGTR